LFTESLRHLLNEKMTAEIPTLHQRACRWYDRHEFGEEAIKHALAAGDSLSAATIIEKNAEMVMKNGGILTILTWIQKLPEELVKAHPMLCIAYAWGVTMQFKPDLAEHWVNEALNSLSLPFDINTIHEDHLPVISNSADRDLVGQVYAVKSILAASRGNAGHSVELSKIALEFLSPDNLFYRSYVAYDQSINHILNGDVLQAQPALQETIRLSQAAGNWMLTMIARSSLGETYAMRGQLSKALATFEQSVPLAVDQSGDPVGFVGHLYIEIGEVYLERNDLLTAQHYITQGLELCKMWLPMLIELDGYYHLAHLKQCLGDHEAALEEIAAMRRLAGDTESLLDDALISIYEIKLALLRGDVRTALSWAQQRGLLNEGLPQPPQDFPITLVDLVKINLARIRIALAQREKQSQHAGLALAMLDDLLPTITRKANVESLMEILVLQSLALQELERTDEALEKIRQAYALAEPEGYRRIFLDEGLPLARLTSRLLAFQKKKADTLELPSREYLSEMLRLFSAPAGETVADASPEQAETLAHPAPENTAALDLLTPRELEVLRMVASGSSNAEIAQALFLALNTVKRHLNNVFLKLGVTTRIQAVAMARRLGIL
jgi:LuxR family maltose regulon positive regulatory protein